MNFEGNRTYVGFGFGPIQAGLFLHEAFLAEKFNRLVVAEINTDLVTAVRQAQGRIWVNIAGGDGVRAEEISGIEVCDPGQPADQESLIAAIGQASDIGTAVPSVKHYASNHPGSLHRLLAMGFARKSEAGGPSCVVYAAENNNQAADILRSAVHSQLSLSEGFHKDNIAFVDTVIGKMSQAIHLGNRTEFSHLRPIVPGYPVALLVEAFNTIFISRIGLPGHSIGFSGFEEKDDLAPFEQAKLYGHNAIHALLGSMGTCLKIPYASEIRHYPEIMAFLRSAFLVEVGAALRKKFDRIDPMFTTQGWIDYADDLIQRMVNPHLMDKNERLIRDLPRKLGWRDRIIGAIRLCIDQDIPPKKLAFGAACALYLIEPSRDLGLENKLALLNQSWRLECEDESAIRHISTLLLDAWQDFRQWKSTGFSPSFLKNFDPS